MSNYKYYSHLSIDFNSSISDEEEGHVIEASNVCMSLNGDRVEHLQDVTNLLKNFLQTMGFTYVMAVEVHKQNGGSVISE